MPQSKKPRKKRKPATGGPRRVVPLPIHEEPERLEPRAMESTMADLARERFGADLVEIVSEDVLEAQAIVYDALDQGDPKERVRLAWEALEVSPDCADAYVILAEEIPTSWVEELELYELGVAAGRRALGDAFDETVGHFWGVLETRGYMRALAGRAEARWHMGAVDESIADVQEMLRLNPNDNQGMRYHLVDHLLIVWRNDEAAELLDTTTYLDDATANWAWSRALLAIRRRDGAVGKLLLDAAKTNPYVARYLLGLEMPPEDTFEHVGFGDESEATVYINGSLPAWLATPGAQYLLEEHLPIDML